MSTVATEQGFRGPAACRIVGISYRQLDYWARSGLVTPSIAEGVGSGSQRLYSFRDLLWLGIAKELCDAGVSLQKIRPVIRCLQDVSAGDEDRAVILVDRAGAYVSTSDGETADFILRSWGVVIVAVAIAKIRDRLAEAVGAWASGGVNAADSRAPRP